MKAGAMPSSFAELPETIKLPLTTVSEVASVEEQLKDMATLKCLVKLC